MGILLRRRSLCHNLLRLFLTLIKVAAAFFLTLTLYMMFLRDPLFSPSMNDALPPKSLFGLHSDFSCYLDQMKFLSGMVLFMDRIRNTAACSKNVENSFINLRNPPPTINKPLKRSKAYHDLHRTLKNKTSQACMASHDCSIEWIIYSTQCSMQLNRLVDSLAAKNIPTTILGHAQGWRGWGHRLRSFHNYLVTLPRNQTVILSDGDDVLLAPGCQATDIMNEFRTRESAISPILLGAEEACWPDWRLWDVYNKKGVVTRPFGMVDPRERDSKHKGRGGLVPWKRIYQYLNAGIIIGTAGVLSDLLKGLYRDECFDDQLAYSLAYLEPFVYYMKDEIGRRAIDSLEDSIMDMGGYFDQYVKAEIEPSVLAKSKEKVAAGFLELEKFFTAKEHQFHDKSNTSKATLSESDYDYSLSGGKKQIRSRPLLALDFDHDVIAAMYGMTMKDIVVDIEAGRVVIKRTHGSPCILHQNGRKIENRLLEEIAQAWGLPYDAAGLAQAAKLRQRISELERAAANKTTTAAVSA